MDIAQTLTTAVTLHRAGRLNEAEGRYRQILAVDPNHTDSLHLLGAIAYQRGQHETAIDLIGKAIAHNNGVADFHCNFANALAALGRLGEAETHFRRAISLDPNHAETHNNYGNVLSEQSRLEEAQFHLRRAIAARPGYAEAHYNLANVLGKLDQTDAAVTEYHQAITLRP